MTDILTVTMNPALDIWARAPQVQPTSKIRCGDVLRHPGGGGINVARVLHRLGVDCAALYPLGGPTGQLLIELLQQEGVASVAVPIAGITRESFTVAAADTGQEYRFVLPGPQLLAQEVEDCLLRITQWRPTPRYVVASGSLPPGVAADFYARLGALCAASGARLVVDTSGPALEAALQAGVYMVKPSWRELRELTGLPLRAVPDVQQAAMQWVQAGKAQLVAVSLGDQGALLATPRGAWLAPALAVQVASSVGAGDSFAAGMVAALAQGHEPSEALRHGAACGAAALLNPGTSLANQADVLRLLGQVALVSLA